MAVSPVATPEQIAQARQILLETRRGLSLALADAERNGRDVIVTLY